MISLVIRQRAAWSSTLITRNFSRKKKTSETIGNPRTYRVLLLLPYACGYSGRIHKGRFISISVSERSLYFRPKWYQASLSAKILRGRYISLFSPHGTLQVQPDRCTINNRNSGWRVCQLVADVYAWARLPMAGQYTAVNVRGKRIHD